MEDPIVLNPLDIIIAAFIIFGMYRGAKKGFFVNASRILTIIFAVIIGFRFRPMAEGIYQDYFNLNFSGELVVFMGFATAFAIGYILVSAVLGTIAKGLDNMKVINLDDAFGAIVGGIGATLLLSVLFIILSFANFPSRENAKGSLLYPPVKEFSRYALGIGANALREANIQINKFGVGAPPASSDAPNPGPPPTSTDKPKAIR